MRPQRIILIRHGESEGNVNRSIYAERPDYSLELSEKGKAQTVEAGKELANKIGEERIMFYVSPHWRTRMTCEGIVQSFLPDQYAIREEPRIREQEWGHLRTTDRNKILDQERDAFGTFYYRIADGESCADVYDRVSGFFDTLFRDFEKESFPSNVIIVTHGMTIRVFLMRWYHWTVEQFERVANPANCEFFVMEKKADNKYELITPLKYPDPAHSYQYPDKVDGAIENSRKLRKGETQQGSKYSYISPLRKHQCVHAYASKDSKVINSKIKEFLQGTHGIIMGTRDAALKPDYCRVMGFEQMDDRHLRFLIDKDSNTSTLENLADNGMIALVMAKPNFECYQFKGRCVSVIKGTEADDQRVSAYLKDLNEVVIQMGVKDGSVYNFPHANIYTILMDVQEIFDQTPKTGTGNKI